MGRPRLTEGQVRLLGAGITLPSPTRRRPPPPKPSALAGSDATRILGLGLDSVTPTRYGGVVKLQGGLGAGANSAEASTTGPLEGHVMPAKRTTARHFEERVCRHCGTTFTCRADTEQALCSHACSVAVQTTSTVQPCAQCGDDVRVKPCLVGRKRFCSRRCAYDFRSQPADVRFWAKVDKEGPTVRPEIGPCWLWTGYIQPHTGYGNFSLTHDHPERAHRYAYTLATGENITPDEPVLHVCDNRACVRNDEPGVYEVNGALLPRVGHLFRGTPADNSADMAAKGRARNHLERFPEVQPRGERHGQARLTTDQVLEIRARYAAGETSPQLAALFGVDPAHIRGIARRKTWKHV